MTPHTRPERSVSLDSEVSAMLESLGILRAQVQIGRVEEDFLARQVDKLLLLLPKLQSERGSLDRQKRLEALYDVSRLLGSSLDLQIVLDQVMDAIIRLTGAERGFLVLRDDDGQLTLAAARNMGQQTIPEAGGELSRTLLNRIIDTGEAVLTTNVNADPRFENNASIVRSSILSIMAAPLRTRGRVIGACYVDNKAMINNFTADDLAALETFAGQAAIAIENAQLFSATDQQLAARVAELQQLRRLDLELTETLDADKAARVTLDWACRLSGAEVGHYGQWIEIAESAGGSPTPHIMAVLHYGVDVQETAPLYLDKLYPQTLHAAHHGTAIRTHKGRAHLLIVPLLREGRALAVIVLRGSQPFTDETQDLVERAVGRGAIAIENARLYAAVQAADRAKSEFVGIVAHDLKVPMTSILGYADLTLMDTQLPPPLIKFQQRIRETIHRMEVLVSDLADISRIESGHFFMEARRVPVADVLQGLREATATQIQARGHQYREEVERRLPDMHVDYYRLLQVLTNLVSNAYKYTPNGGTITVTVRRHANRIAFSVADTGIGLSRDAIRKLGTRFWRGDDEFTRAQPGTGLGFAITRSLVEQMGSSILIESVVGQGSTFTFSVPMAEQGQ